MKKTIILLLGIVLFSACDSLQIFPKNSKGIDKIPNEFFELGEVKMKNQIETIDFEMINKLPVCQVEINGKKYRFLIDTGALTIIPREVFDELELAVRYRGMFNDFNNEKPQVKDFVILPSLKINNLEFKDIGAVAFTIENDLMKCLYDGIIGANMLAKLKWKFDYSNKKAYASKSMEDLIEEQIDYSFPFTTNRQKSPYIKGKILGKSLNFLFDTGYNGRFSVPNEYAFYKENSAENQFITTTGVQSVGLYGPSNTVKSFVLKAEVEVAEMTFPDELISGGNGAFMGSEFLADYIYLMNWEDQVIYLKKNKKPTQNLKIESFGYGSLFVNGKLQVVKIIEEANSPLKIGDEIQSINNHVYTDVCAYVLDNQERELDEIELQIKRGKKVLNFTLYKEEFLD